MSRNKLCKAKTGVGPTLTWSNEALYTCNMCDMRHKRLATKVYNVNVDTKKYSIWNRELMGFWVKSFNR